MRPSVRIFRHDTSSSAAQRPPPPEPSPSTSTAPPLLPSNNTEPQPQPPPRPPVRMASSRTRSRTLTCIFGGGGGGDRGPRPRNYGQLPELASGEGTEEGRENANGNRERKRGRARAGTGSSAASGVLGLVRSVGSSNVVERVRSRTDSLTGSLVGSLGSLTERDIVYHPDEVVQHLSVIDPAVAAVGHLQDAANSIFLPPLTGVYDRMLSVNLPSTPPKPPRDVEKGGGADEDEDGLDAHVQHLLTKKEQFRRTMKGVWAFLKTPVGVLAFIYFFAIVFWGCAIVIFLAKWINFYDDYRQKLWVEISMQIINFLFCTAIIFIPWRARDTYRILRIWHYARLTRKRRAERGLPPLENEDDLPKPADDPDYVHVLSDEEERDLEYQQEKFHASQTFYRPHATETHRAFPIYLAVWIMVMNDGNSGFQIMLAGALWGWWGYDPYYKSPPPHPKFYDRPAALDALGIVLAFLCGIAAGCLIWYGSVKSKKTEEVTQKLRQALMLPADEGFWAAEEEQERSRLRRDVVRARDLTLLDREDRIEGNRHAEAEAGSESASGSGSEMGAKGIAVPPRVHLAPRHAAEQPPVAL